MSSGVEAPRGLAAIIAAIWLLLAVALGAGEARAWLPAVPSMWNAWINAPEITLHRFGTALGAHLIALAGIAAALAAAGAIGSLPGRLLRLDSLQCGYLPVRLALGFCAVSGIQQGIGYAGLLFPGLVRVELALLALGGLCWAWRSRARLRPSLDGPVPWVPLALVGISLALAFLLSRIPDTHEDPLNYHFAAPEHYLLLHRINVEPQHLMFQTPLGFEMLYTLAFPLGGMLACKAANFAVILLAVAAAFRLGASLGGPVAGWWSAGLFASCGLLADHSWQGKNDLAVAGTLLVAAWLAMSRPSLVASAWFAGCALAMKLPSGFTVLALAAGTAWFVRPSPSRLPGLALAGALPVSGWLVGNWLFLGNPLHPFLSGLFPDIAWNPAMQDALWRLDEVLRGPGIASVGDLGRGAWRALGSPSSGSLALAALLFPALLAARRKPAAMLGLAVVTAYLLWLPSQRNARFIFPAVAWSAALAGAYAAGLSGLAARLRGFAALAALAAFALGAARHMAPAGVLTLSGHLSADEYAARRFTTWEAVRRWTHKALPEGAFIRLTGGERRVGYRGRVMSHHVVTEPFYWRLTRDSASPEEVRKRVRQVGLTHHIHNFVSGEYRQSLWYPGPAWSPRQLALYREFIARYYRPVYSPPAIDLENGGFWVFRISPHPLPRARLIHYLPFTEDVLTPAWRLMKAGRFPGATAAAERVVREAPDVMQYRLALGTIQGAAGDWKGSRRSLEPGIRAGFVSLWEGTNLGAFGAALGNLKDYDEAVRWLARAAILAGNIPGGTEALGLCLVIRGQARIMRGSGAAGIRDIEASLPLIRTPDTLRAVRNLLYHLRNPGSSR